MNKQKASSRRAFTLVEVMIVSACIGLLAAVAIPGLFRAKVTANETTAQVTLRNYANACELFILTTGVYPANEVALTDDNPPYLTRPMNNVTKDGYSYEVSLVNEGYTLLARAVVGTWNYRIATGTTMMRQPKDGGVWEDVK